nr:hypothetical protein [Tanacetum cinerariifolium]
AAPAPSGLRALAGPRAASGAAHRAAARKPARAPIRTNNEQLLIHARYLKLGAAVALVVGFRLRVRHDGLRFAVAFSYEAALADALAHD